MPLLTGPQKAALATLARTAFDEQTAQGNTGGMTSDQFRKIVVHKATEGRATGLTSADGSDYLAIRRELLTLAGRDVEAFETAMKESTQRRDNILFCVRRGGECHSRQAFEGLGNAYHRRRFRALRVMHADAAQLFFNFDFVIPHRGALSIRQVAACL